MRSQRWVWLVAAAVAVVVVIVVAGLLRKPSPEQQAGDEQYASGTRSTPGATTTAGGAAGEVPYGVDTRPMPEGEDLDTLLPLQVGPYTRESVEPPYAHYRRGTNTIFFELGICADASEAQMGVSNAEGETNAEFPDSAERSVYSLEGDPSYFKYAGFMAWTRGRYLFLVNTGGEDADLDEFMKAFPY